MMWAPVLLAVLASTTTATPVSDHERHQVIVVGAGASGFAAAVSLLEHNVTDLIVLEASDRIGGRIHTVEFGGVTLDKGAEFVNGEKNNSVYDMVGPYYDQFLTSYQPQVSPERFLFTNTTGHVFNNTYVRDLVDNAYSIFSPEDVAGFNGSVADYFYLRFDELVREKNVEPYLAEALRFYVPILERSDSIPDDLSELGAWGFADASTNEGDVMIKWKSGGFSNVFDFLSKKFPNPAEELPVSNKIQFGKEVTRIEHSEDGVTVKCADGSTYLADHVIVTVSLGVLKKHAASMFHPALPPDKTAAVETMGFGCLGKVFSLFPNRWWPNETSIIIPLFSEQELEDFKSKSPQSAWAAYMTGFHAVLNHNRMLLSWFSGRECKAMDTMSDEEIIDGLMDLLHTFFGKLYDIPRPEAILRSGWATYPYTLGSYSYRTMGSDRANITNDDLALPIYYGDKPVVLFAGEATNRDFSGYVHGALDTGRREARRLLDYFNKHAVN